MTPRNCVRLTITKGAITVAAPPVATTQLRNAPPAPATARTARACGLYETSGAIAGWLLETAEGDADRALSLDAPVGQLRLAQARSHLAEVLLEEGRTPRVAYNPTERRRIAEEIERAMGLAQ